jgi:hypothetical protein
MPRLTDSLPYEVRRLCDGSVDAERWRILVAEREATTPYHTLAWEQTIESLDSTSGMESQ